MSGDWFENYRAVTAHDLHQLERRIMLSIQAIQDGIATLTTKVQAQTSLDASTATLLAGLAATNKQLADEVAALQVGSLKQSDLDGIAAALNGQADALTQGTAQLQAAIPANTPASDPNAVPPVAPTPQPVLDPSSPAPASGAATAANS